MPFAPLRRGTRYHALAPCRNAGVLDRSGRREILGLLGAPFDPSSAETSALARRLWRVYRGHCPALGARGATDLRVVTHARPQSDALVTSDPRSPIWAAPSRSVGVAGPEQSARMTWGAALLAIALRRVRVDAGGTLIGPPGR